MSLFPGEQYKKLIVDAERREQSGNKDLSSGAHKKSDFHFDKLNLDRALGISRPKLVHYNIRIPLAYSRSTLTGVVFDISNSHIEGQKELAIYIEQSLDIADFPNILSGLVGKTTKVRFPEGSGNIKKSDRINFEIEVIPDFPLVQLIARSKLDDIVILNKYE